MYNNPLDFVSGIISQYSLRLRRIIVKVNYDVILDQSVRVLLYNHPGQVVRKPTHASPKLNVVQGFSFSQSVSSANFMRQFESSQSQVSKRE